MGTLPPTSPFIKFIDLLHYLSDFITGLVYLSTLLIYLAWWVLHWVVTSGKINYIICNMVRITYNTWLFN